METQNKLGTAFLKKLIMLKESRGAISIDDVGDILEGMAETLTNQDTQPDKFLHRELSRMVQHIDQAKSELVTLSAADAASPKSIENANTQLDAVVKATEEATNTIMDAVDEIQGLAGKPDAASKAKIEAACARIYDACNFQDLTGQRITKVLGCLEYIEAKITRLSSLFSKPEDASSSTETLDKLSQKEKRAEKHLLHGPSLPGDTPSQKEIDALFSNLG